MPVLRRVSDAQCGCGRHPVVQFRRLLRVLCYPGRAYRCLRIGGGCDRRACISLRTSSLCALLFTSCSCTITQYTLRARFALRCRIRVLHRCSRLYNRLSKQSLYLCTQSLEEQCISSATSPCDAYRSPHPTFACFRSNTGSDTVPLYQQCFVSALPIECS